MKTTSTFIAKTTRIATGLLVLTTTLLAISATALATETTQNTSALPDNRQYELVTASGEGEPYLPPTPISDGRQDNSAFHANASLQFRAAINGDGLAYAAEPSPLAGSGSTGNGEGNQWLAFRSTSGWQSTDVTPTSDPATGYVAELGGAIFQSFSGDLTNAFIQGGIQRLSSAVEEGCQSLYIRPTSSGTFSPLFDSGQAQTNCGHPLFTGTSTDETHVLFQSEAALTLGAKEATEADLPPGRGAHGPEAEGEGCLFACNLYEASGGKLQLVNEVEGKPVPSATFGGYPKEKSELTNFSNAISEDGSKIFWTDTQAGPDMEHVYVHEDGRTAAVSAGAAEYWTATPDGRYAYYTEDGQLWRFDTDTDERMELTSAGAEVQGVIGTNQTGEDGAYVYFVANGVLTSSPNSHGDLATQGECPAPQSASAGCNLYLLRKGRVAFVARLAGKDDSLNSTSNNEHGGDWQTNLGERVAEITPDGSHLVFESLKELTGYQATPANPAREVFVYAADEGVLSCASCNPTGGPSTAQAEELESKLPIGGSEVKTYIHHWISADGTRVFFDSGQPLVAWDTDGTQDVYEWERPAVPGEVDNSCTAERASSTTGGCTFLLSGGISKQDSFLVDSDATGENVFFEHIGSVGQVQAPLDDNELYDARVNGGFPVVSLACTGTGCQGVPPAPPIFATPASATFGGVGNFTSPKTSGVAARSLTTAQKLARALKVCNRGMSRKLRAKCVERARGRYGRKTTGKVKKVKASYNRRVQS